MPKPSTCPEASNASLSSRIRGLVLGLALGDAVGSQASDVSAAGLLEAGAATQFAAWTIEGTLRSVTRYGRVEPGLPEVGMYAYQRWAFLRGLEPKNQEFWFPFMQPEDDPTHARYRGWLVDDPVMANVRGTSPSTAKALVTGAPVASAGCQALLRTLPVAAMALSQHSYWDDRPDPTQLQTDAEEWGRNLALLTHDDGQRQSVTVLGIRILVECLKAEDDLPSAISRATRNPSHGAKVDILGVLTKGLQAPCVPQTLERLAPDKTSWSALAGGLYVALSFPAEDTIAEAIEFAGWAPDGDSVAAVAGAILGARHGYEALPANWLGRLELGWVMDRLAGDLAAEVLEHQGGECWKSDGPEDGLVLVDPWWDTKYPGI